MADITIGPRKFRLIRRSTAFHDTEVGKIARRAGLHSITVAESDTNEFLEAQLYFALRDSGESFAMLGALLIPAEVENDLDWTPELAEKTATCMRELWEPEHKAAQDVVLVGLVTDFFGPVLHSLRSLQRASRHKAQLAPNGPNEGTRSAETTSTTSAIGIA